MDSPAATETSPAAPAAAAYVPELDALRAFAIFSVMCLHWLPREHFFNRWPVQANWGVYLFFVLSGFLITRILMRCRENQVSGKVGVGWSLRQFYIRRFLRIFPVYYFILILGFSLNAEGVRPGFAWHALYLSNFYFIRQHGFYGLCSHFWTLAVEEQFYLIWPFAILLLPRKALLPTVIFVATLGLGLQAWTITFDWWSKLLMPSNVGFLALGALVAMAEHPLCGSTALRRRLLQVYMAAGAASLAMYWVVRYLPHVPRRPGLEGAFSHTSMAFLFAVLIARVADGVPGVLGKVLRFAPLVYLGRISYGIYIFHPFVRHLLLWAQPHLITLAGAATAARTTQTFAAKFLATVVIASISWFAFERPINELKRFFPYSSRRRSLTLEERGIPVPPTAVDVPVTPL